MPRPESVHRSEKGRGRRIRCETVTYGDRQLEQPNQLTQRARHQLQNLLGDGDDYHESQGHQQMHETSRDIETESADMLMPAGAVEGVGNLATHVYRGLGNDRAAHHDDQALAASGEAHTDDEHEHEHSSKQRTVDWTLPQHCVRHDGRGDSRRRGAIERPPATAPRCATGRHQSSPHHAVYSQGTQR